MAECVRYISIPIPASQKAVVDCHHDVAPPAASGLMKHVVNMFNKQVNSYTLMTFAFRVLVSL
jgi:hypothetical protein